MTLLSTLADGIGGAVTAMAGQHLVIGDNGLPTWVTGHPLAQLRQQYSEYENGGAGSTAQGLNAWLTNPIGAGAVRAAITGEPGWFQNAGTIETGSTATGGMNLFRTVGVAFSASSGTWVNEAVFSLPVLSNGTDTYGCMWGIADSANGITASNGAFLRYTHGTNGGRFEFVTCNAGVKTIIDTGVTVVAGAYYHIRIEQVNNTSAFVYIKTVFNGGSWADDGKWTAASLVATSSTNLSSGVLQSFGGLGISKTLGTTSCKMKIGHHMAQRVPAFVRTERVSAFLPGLMTGGDGTGIANGAKGTALAISHQANSPDWLAPLRIKHPIVFYAYGRGGLIPTVSHDMGFVVANSGSASATVIDNGYYGLTNLNTSGVNALGSAAFATSVNLQLDASVQPMVIESSFKIGTLSTGAQQFVAQVGLVDSLTAATANGCWVEIDSSVNGAAQCVCALAGTKTTVSSALTIVAGTQYVARLVITSTSVAFYLRADGATAWGSPVATITTNIPTGVAMAAAAIARSLVGTNNKILSYTYLLAFQRSTT